MPATFPNHLYAARGDTRSSDARLPRRHGVREGRERRLEFTTAAPVPAGAFRYAIMVDGVRTLDPVNTKTSESNTAMWSMFFVPGIALEEVKDVLHGAISEVFYASSVLKMTRRMHVYTPPGYEAGSRKYPVFYLLHGAGDTDDGWTSVGRAGFILDNLIAAKQAVPMVVVMPAGHQPARPGSAPGAAATGPPAAAPAPPAINPFTLEFMNDVVPYVERHYRVLTDRPNRAIAGLSMGGSQTLDIAFRHLAKFAYIGRLQLGRDAWRRRGPAPAPHPRLLHPRGRRCISPTSTTPPSSRVRSSSGSPPASTIG